MTKGQAERLFPLIEQVLTDADRAYEHLSAIVVATGPGNFTGIRIGVASARGLALALNLPCVGVSVPQALAFAMPGRATAIVDARGGSVYAQEFQDGHPVGDVTLIDRAQIATPEICGNDGHPPPQSFAAVALSIDWQNAARPAPLYVRPPVQEAQSARG